MIKRLNRYCANNSLPKAPKLVVLYRALYPDGIKKKPLHFLSRAFESGNGLFTLLFGSLDTIYVIGIILN